MTDTVLIFILSSIGLALALLVLPRQFAHHLIIASGATLLGILAPFALMWLVAQVLLLVVAARIGDKTGKSDAITILLAIIFGAALLFLRDIDLVVWIGAAYFTLRNLHVLFDWWMGRYPMPGLRELFLYNLFLPTIIVGPIHRFPNFTREWQRRRVSMTEVATGAEQVLFGLARAVILGIWLVNEISAPVRRAMESQPGFFTKWAMSAFDWVELYFIFAGLSSVAIGTALMMGIRIEENFNYPFRAMNLVEFWSRWHMSLSLWCRDYVYQPIASVFRSPVTGVIAAMLVLGLWHETSVYYILWAMWQAIGIISSRILSPFYPPVPKLIQQVLNPVLVLCWLSLSKPVCQGVLSLGGFL